MAIYADLSGNNPHSENDARIGGHMDLQAVAFRGDIHTIVVSTSSQQTPIFSRRCRAIRISPAVSAPIHYEIGLNPTAVTESSPFLAAGAVEIVRVRFPERIAIIDPASAHTNDVHIQEDLS